MKLDADTWARVSLLFDRIADLPPEQREDTLERERPDPEVRRWLLQLLAAHDAPDDLLIDRTLHGVVEALDPTAGGDEEQRLPERVGPWRLVEELGRGGMGRVMLAERADGGYQQRVALKLIDREIGRDEAEALRREVRLLARLEHPGIVRLIDADLADDARPYLAMEQVEGDGLAAWCESTPATLYQRIGMLRQVGAALIHAHGRLVVHGDLKPSNVLVDRQGRARLLDFGIGRWLREQETGLAARLRCSPAWCAPEQLQGATPDVAQDVFGLGALAWHLLTGRRIREGSAITHWLIGRPMTDIDLPVASTSALPGLSRGRIRGDLDAIVQRAVAVDPAQRYASIEAMDQDLARWQAGLPVSARPLNRTLRFGRWLRRHRVPAAAAAVALVALIGGLVAAQSSARIARAAAEQARVEAQRADSVRDFVLDLFRAADPMRAGGAELSTRAVLAQAGTTLEATPELPPEVRLDILTLLADVQRTLDWFDDADELLDRAEALLAANPELPGPSRIETLRQRALLEDRLGRPEAALEILVSLRRELEQGAVDEHLPLLARVLVASGVIQARRYEFDAAIEALEAAEPLFGRLDPPLHEFEQLALSSRAVAAYHADDFESALQLMQRSIEASRRLGNEGQAGMVTNLGTMAAILGQLGRLDEAMEREREAVEIARAAFPAGHHMIGRALYAMGDTLRQLGRQREALAALDEARSIQQAAGLERELELIDLTRARSLLAVGDFTEAAALARELRRLHESAGQVGGREALLTLLIEIEAQSALEPQDLDRLIEEARTALELAPADQSRHSVNDLLRTRLAQIELDRDRPERIDRWLEHARSDRELPDHASVRLRWLSLKLLQTLRRTEANDPSLVDALHQALPVPGSNADARAHAWLALAEAALISADRNATLDAATAMDRLLADPSLSRAERMRIEALRPRLIRMTD